MSSQTHHTRFPLVSYEPLKLIYRLLRTSAVLAQLPLWLLLYAFRSARPQRNWTLKQSLLNTLVKRLVDINSTIGVTETLTLNPGVEKDRFVTISPFAAKLYAGPLLSQDVAPATIGGTWYPAALPQTNKYVPGPNGLVVLHIHGGAFVVGDGRTAFSGFCASLLAAHLPADAVFCPQYRLSSYSNNKSNSHKTANPFPAALQDVLTSYLYLLRTLDIPASSIVLSGDSAGGNLAIALLRYLTLHGSSLSIPPPSACLLFSPWVDPKSALGPKITYTSNPSFSTDYLPPSFLQWGARAYPSPPAYPLDSEWISPLGKPFATGGVPVFVNVGASELFEVACSRWVGEMEGEGEGNVVGVNYEEDASHDTVLSGAGTGWEESARGVVVKAGLFIRQQQKKRDD